MKSRVNREDGSNLALAVHMDRADAVEELVGAYQNGLYGYARRLLGDPEDAREVVQDVLVRAYRCFVFEYDRERCRDLALKPWLFRVARNLALNQLRKRRNDPLDEEKDPACLELDDSHWPFRVVEARATLERALTRLGPEQRDLVTLRFVEGMTYSEIAAVTGIGEAAARGKIFRTLKQLRVFLSEE